MCVMTTEASYDEESRWEDEEEEESDSESWGDHHHPQEEDMPRGSEGSAELTSGSGEGGEQYVELMYQDKLRFLKRSLEELQEGIHPEYSKKLRKLESALKERHRFNDLVRQLEINMVTSDYLREKVSCAQEFEEQKLYLRESLVAELEDKMRLIESERGGMELGSGGDAMELKTISTRKLRRRTNIDGGGSGGHSGGGGGIGGSDKRRKMNVQNNVQLLLEENEILEDLRIVNKNKTYSKSPSVNNPSYSNSTSSAAGSGPSSSSSSSLNYIRETRIEDGKLFYEKKWFRRGQAVQVESFNGEKFPAMISSVGNEAICVRKSENTKIRIYLSQLAKGKYSLKRRAV